MALGLGKGGEVEIDLIDAVDKSFVTPVDSTKPLSTRRADREIEYGENNLAGGLLFGGGSATSRMTDDSEFGPDTRDLSGTIHLRRTDDGSNPSLMKVSQTITFKYAIHDALDFCPGNTLQKSTFTVDRLEYNEMITVLSRLEASGLARDVEYTVAYHRETSLESLIAIAPRRPRRRRSCGFLPRSCSTSTRTSPSREPLRLSSRRSATARGIRIRRSPSRSGDTRTRRAAPRTTLVSPSAGRTTWRACSRRCTPTSPAAYDRWARA